uniref:Ion transport domain-containing protein n=1 Tax=Panagrolaimus davidi TaxID=227884 RepID=A0A914R6F5_9BILA
MSFLRFAPIFVMFLLPFAILFHVLLGEKRNIASFLGTFVQILVMMIGELDYKSLGATNTTFVTTTMFCLFLFIVTIFLMNLLIGLAVSDITKILEKAAITRRIMQIETIHHVELAMPEFLRKKFWKGFCQNEKAFKDFENEKHYFTTSKFRQWFKWVGLPKSAIGTMNDVICICRNC